MSDRNDPALGDLPIVEDRRESPTPASRRGLPTPQSSHWKWWVGIAAAAVIAMGGFALVHWRNAIGARLVPPPQQNRVMQQAAAALRAGRLTSPDGHGARELYEAVMARDPDDLAAREGLVRVANAALAQAQAAVGAHRIDEAQRALDLARELSAPVVAVQKVEASLRGATGSEAQIAALLDRAAAAERAGHLDDGDDSALAIYQQAIAAAPDNALVLDRRRTLLAKMLGGIDALLASGDVAGAQKLVDRVAGVDPGNLDLPNARARLADASQRQQREQARLLDGADADLRAGRIDAAVATWRQVLAQSPDDARAGAGLRAAGEALVREANHDASDFDFAGAQAALDKARTLAPELPSLRATTQHLAQARMQRAGMDRALKGKQGITDLLAAADHAIVRDELVDPPGDSAFDKLHEAAAIAPADPRVIAARKRFVATVAACVQGGMTDNRLAHASACLDALATIQPTYASLPSLRAELARHWLAYADERIGAGELDTAQRAIDSAKRLTPDDPAIAALQARARQARAGTASARK
ncbi:MAG TPA: hypothetical protein VGH80_08675 [Xanthomonadaceae bacterium]|jgi:tetratricopeptide (TPR) repeat protein